MTTPYVDPQSVHNPATGTSPPASWGDTVRADLEFLVQPPSCRVSRIAALTVANATETAVPFTATDSWDSDAFHDTVTNNTRITIPTGLGGRYLLSANCFFDNGTTTGNYMLRWRLNGTTAISDAMAPGASLGTRLSNTTVYALNAGDYVEVTVYQSSGGSLSLFAASPNVSASVTFIGRS